MGNRHAADGMTEIYADGLHWQDQKDDESMFKCSFLLGDSELGLKVPNLLNDG